MGRDAIKGRGQHMEERNLLARETRKCRCLF